MIQANHGEAPTATVAYPEPIETMDVAALRDAVEWLTAMNSWLATANGVTKKLLHAENVNRYLTGAQRADLARVDAGYGETLT